MYSLNKIVSIEWFGHQLCTHVHTCSVSLPLFVGETVDVGIAVADEVIVCIDAVDKMAVVE